VRQQGNQLGSGLVVWKNICAIATNVRSICTSICATYRRHRRLAVDLNDQRQNMALAVQGGLGSDGWEIVLCQYRWVVLGRGKTVAQWGDASQREAPSPQKMNARGRGPVISVGLLPFWQ
jgi:hypothetical protein